MKRNSIASNWRVEPWTVISIAALVAVLFYLIVSELIFQLGFPLDDTWIHLTYARNLAEHGEWAFRLGDHSAGSTAPLWTALLAIGFLLKLAPYVWTYLLGWVVLTLLGIHAEKIARKLVVAYQPRIPWVGLFFVFEWHLTWSAVSGMETLLHGLITFVVLTALLNGSRRYLALGLLAGLSVWVRPDGLTLLGPILFTAVLSEGSWSARGQTLLKTLIGFGALFFPYLLFNLALSGNPMPNTFYAKQAEYGADWLARPLIERVSDYLLPMIVSPFLVLIPSALIWLVKRIHAGSWGTLAGSMWFIGYIAIYFMRLPAYQHGRYIVPALLIMYLWGLLGLIEIINSSTSNNFVMNFWKVITVVLCLAFVFLGARTYAVDVAFIESEMVAAAKWAAKNLPSDAVLAVHDIGAMGYFDGHKLIDLAGLISPEVVSFIRNQTKVAEYLDEENADYLVTFPEFYRELVSQHERIYSTHGPYAPALGGENIGIYRWK
jgi:hypothetical protein